MLLSSPTDINLYLFLHNTKLTTELYVVNYCTCVELL